MIDYDALRAELDAKVRQVVESKSRRKRTESRCEHAWTKYRLTVHPHRGSYLQPQFMGIGAYFIVLACPKCKVKQFVDYVVEK